jgi:hypothetical protein
MKNEKSKMKKIEAVAFSISVFLLKQDNENTFVPGLTDVKEVLRFFNYFRNDEGR